MKLQNVFKTSCKRLEDQDQQGTSSRPRPMVHWARSSSCEVCCENAICLVMALGSQCQLAYFKLPQIQRPSDSQAIHQNLCYFLCIYEGQDFAKKVVCTTNLHQSFQPRLTLLPFFTISGGSLHQAILWMTTHAFLVKQLKHVARFGFGRSMLFVRKWTFSHEYHKYNTCETSLQ